MLQAPFSQNEQAGLFGDVKYSYASQLASAVHAAAHWAFVKPAPWLAWWIL
jgi:hypothetical protein